MKLLLLLLLLLLDIRLGYDARAPRIRNSIFRGNAVFYTSGDKKMSNQNTVRLYSLRNYGASKHGIVLSTDVEFTSSNNGFLSYSAAETSKIGC